MRQTLITLAILGVICLIVGIFFTRPAWQTWQKARRDYLGAKQDLERLSAKRQLTKQLEEAEPVLGERAAMAKRLIPPSEERELFVGEIDSLAKNSGVELLNLNFVTNSTKRRSAESESESNEEAESAPKANTNKTKESGQVKRLSYFATLRGPFSAILRFVDELDRLKRYTLLTTLVIESGNTPDQLSVTLNGEIFTKGEPKIPADQSFSPTVWQYLDDRQTASPIAIPSGGRTDPFAAY